MKNSFRRLSTFVSLTMGLALAQTATAGTVYRDRFIPGGVCMVDFHGQNINAALIQHVSQGPYKLLVGEWKVWKSSGFFSASRIDPNTYRNATLLRVLMVNGQKYDHELPETQAEAAKQAFLRQLKDTCRANDSHP